MIGVAQVLVGVLVPAELLHDHARLDAQPGRHAGAVDAHPCCSSMGDLLLTDRGVDGALSGRPTRAERVTDVAQP